MDHILNIGLFVLGLFVGSNLGVGLMCLLQINAPRKCDTCQYAVEG